MIPMIILFVTITLVMVNNQRSFVDTAPVLSAQSGSPEVVPQYQDENVVRDLESLKNNLGKSLEMMKMHSEVYTNFNGHKEAHSNTKEQLNKDGKMVAKLGQQMDALPGPNGNPVGKLRTKVDIPSKGIHKTLEQKLDSSQQMQGETENGNRRTPNLEMSNSDNPERDSSYSGIQYSPLDMAEYVFWTGDEKGVTLAIEEFLQEGLMSREEAISFLQEIKYNLDYLQKHYTEVGLNTRERSKEKESTPNGLFYNMRAENSRNIPKTNQYIANPLTAEKKNTASWSNFLKEQTKFDQNKVTKHKEQYDELLERLRVADFLYTEYSLEEVIYQLAKVMFTQSLTRGSLEAQQSLQKFTSFLENEAEQGRISRALEKKVLDVLIASLTDTLSEHPELTAINSQEPNLSEPTSRENLMKQLLILNNDEHKIMEDILSPNYTNAVKRSTVNTISDQLQSNEKKLSLDIDKYKHP